MITMLPTIIMSMKTMTMRMTATTLTNFPTPSLTQWCAVRTCLSLMRLPPQPSSAILTIQGNWLGRARDPPLIRSAVVAASLLRPQSQSVEEDLTSVEIKLSSRVYVRTC